MQGNVDSLIYVIDANDEERIEECNESFQELLKEDNLKNIPVLVYSNKADIKACLGPYQITEKLKLNGIIRRDWFIFSCSALNGDNVKDGMKWVFEKLSEN